MSPSTGKNHKSRWRRWLGRLTLLALLAVLAVVGAGGWVWWRLNIPFRAAGAQELVTIAPGTSAGRILDQLAAAGLIADARLARLYLVRVLRSPPLKAGEYRFTEPLSTPQVLAKLISGEVVSHPVTLVEGLTLEETAEQLAAAGFGELPELLAAMRDPGLIRDVDPQAPDLEGYLFPDTYHFAHGTPAEQVVRTLVTHFRHQMTAEVEPLLPPPERRSRDLRQLVTLASIVEKEARLDEERPIIAGVYANRLRQGIALYADPTVIFALKRLGRWNGNLRRPDLQLDSPYNTYRYPGLPPGPIASPGLSSLLAAAQPADVPYLYFVSRNDGSHVFARTLAEHNRNVEQWQKRYWRERWARQR